MSLPERTPPANSSRPDIEVEQAPSKIVIFICPTEGCGNYYADPSFTPSNTEIYQMQYARMQEMGVQNPTHNRVECPACRLRGLGSVQRVPYLVAGVIPWKAIEAHAKREKSTPKTAAL